MDKEAEICVQECVWYLFGGGYKSPLVLLLFGSKPANISFHTIQPNISRVYTCKLKDDLISRIAWFNFFNLLNIKFGIDCRKPIYNFQAKLNG